MLPQNLGLGYIASYLEKYGHNVKIIDSLAEGYENVVKCEKYGEIFYRVGLEYSDIAKKIPTNTDIVGITAPFTNTTLIIKELSSVVKKLLPAKPIVIGGIFPSTLSHEAVMLDVDYVIRGEGETPFLELASGKDPANIKGLVFKKGSTVIDNGVAYQIKNLDEIPFPARHFLPMEKYLRISPRGERNRCTASIITSRGCPYDCTFCSIHSMYGYKYRYRSPENVLQEIKILIEQYDINHIEFEDDNLTLNIKRAQAIFEGIINLDRKITWAAPNGIRIDTLTWEMLETIKMSGCISLNLAVESGDPFILQKMNKKSDLTKIEEVTKMCGKLGIITKGCFILGYPGEDRESYEKSISYAKQLREAGMSVFYFNIIQPLPGTKLYQECLDNNYLIDRAAQKRLFLGNKVHITTKELSKTEVMRRVRNANHKLSTRPRILILVIELMQYLKLYGFLKFIYKSILSRKVYLKASQKR